MANKDLRDWISDIESAGELKIIKGAEPKEEIGGFVDIYKRKMGNPAVMFDEVPGFPKGHRVIANILTSVPRINLALGLPAAGIRDRADPVVAELHEERPVAPTESGQRRAVARQRPGRQRRQYSKHSHTGLARARRRPVHRHGVHGGDEGSGQAG